MASEAGTLDVRGARCPIPVLKARKRMKAVGRGETLRLISDDPVAAIDVPHFCREDKHQLIEQSQTPDGAMIFVIRKSG